MAFHEVRFPDDIAFGAVGGPVYNTDVVTLVNGHERRRSIWSQPRSRYDVSYGLKTSAQKEALIHFYRAREGRAHGFRYKDWLDYQAQHQQIATGDGVTLSFQLVKHYTSGGEDIVRPIVKPVAGTVAVYVDDIVQSMPGDVDVDSQTGMITFALPPALNSAITVDFEFDVPVRFDVDALLMQIEHHERYRWDRIELVELLL